jgi:hypothetical protein
MFEFLMGSKPDCPVNQVQPKVEAPTGQGASTGLMEQMASYMPGASPKVEPPKVGGRRSRRRRYRRIKSRIRKRR